MPPYIDVAHRWLTGLQKNNGVVLSFVQNGRINGIGGLGRGDGQVVFEESAAGMVGLDGLGPMAEFPAADHAALIKGLGQIVSLDSL